MITYLGLCDVELRTSRVGGGFGGLGVPKVFFLGLGFRIPKSFFSGVRA